MNKWLIYQTITSRLNGKTGFYQSGGATGFRDQLQDSLGMKWIDINILKNQIIESSKHQFKEGDVMHWWHTSNKTGIRTQMSDDRLWLPYSVIEYINFTEDYQILEEKTEYAKGITLDGYEEKYGKFDYTEEKETIYEHCIRAIEKSLDFGENGFPKIGTGDWNDSLNKIGNKGKGESIWLGFFLYDILNKWEKILEYKGDNDKKEKYSKIKNELKKDPKFIQMCQNRAMSENEKLEELEMQIENLKGKKNYIEESIAELELHHKKQRKQLAEEFEKEKQINNARIIEMQNTTIEQEKDKPSFWNKIADKIFNFKIVATVSFVMYQLSNKVPPERILKNVKHFRKNYDKYVENPELIQRELKIMEYMDIGLSKIEESEKIDLNKEKSRDDYDLEL